MGPGDQIQVVRPYPLSHLATLDIKKLCLNRYEGSAFIPLSQKRMPCGPQVDAAGRAGLSLIDQ